MLFGQDSVAAGDVADAPPDGVDAGGELGDGVTGGVGDGLGATEATPGVPEADGVTGPWAEHPVRRRPAASPAATNTQGRVGRGVMAPW